MALAPRRNKSDSTQSIAIAKNELEAKQNNTDNIYNRASTIDKGSETTLSSGQGSLAPEVDEKRSKDKDFGYREENEDDDKLYDQKPITWVNIIFLPFESWWQLIILFCVFVKCFFAPFAAIYPAIRCSQDTVSSYSDFLIFFYMNFADPLYMIDTFMYILHRQVADAAMKREHLPKAAWMIFLDIFGLVPFFVLFGGEYCQHEAQLWPNIAQYSELLISYRIGQYFSLNVNHSYWQLIIGYSLYFVIMINALTALLLILTKHGLCSRCHKGIYDWRAYNYERMVASGDAGEYVYAASLVAAVLTHRMDDETLPATYAEFAIIDILAVTGYILIIYIFVPKLFAECVYHFSRIYHFQPRVKRILTILSHRKLPDDYVQVENFYNVIWKKQNGVSKVPKVIFQLPKNLQTDLRLDLTWMVFYHSPNLRSTSVVFQRWLSAHIQLIYKLPGEKFFYDGQCLSKLYYIKSGIVQIFSSDDSNASVLSVSSGTIFGDVNFFLPQDNKKLSTRCLTYCEVFSISRHDLLKALIKFPDDRRRVFKLIKERLKHAHQLHENKKQIKVEDRNEEEGIDWLKKRWWHVIELIMEWKRTSNRKSCKIPVEEMPYRCPKYIGQLVLCKDINLRESSLFFRLEFPYVFAANSVLVNYWRKIVLITVIVVLIWFPPALARLECGNKPAWFEEVSFGVSTLYIIDILFFMITAKEDEEILYDSIFGSIFDRCKDKRFVLDVLSSPIIDIFFSPKTLQKYQNLACFNRLIKTHIIFDSMHKKDWSHNHQFESYLRMSLFLFLLLYVPPFAIVVFSLSTSYLSLNHFFYDGDYEDGCGEHISNLNCAMHIINEHGAGQLFYDWIGNLILFCHGITYYIKGTLYDVVAYTLLMICYIIVCVYLRVKNISILYLKHQPVEDFQYLVSKIKQYYSDWRTHPNLMKRLNRYFYVHWKYQKGIHFLHSNLLVDEPFNIYWKLYGQVAEKVIAESKVFKGADPALIRKLVPKAKFIIIPRNGNIVAFGMLSEDLTFLLRGVVICEYQDANNDIQKKIIASGTTMGVTTVFFKQPVIKSFAAVTDVEILCVSRADLLQVLHHHPQERGYFQTCIKEMGLKFDTIFKKEILRQKDYQTQVRNRIFHNEMIDKKTLKPAKKKLDSTKKKKCCAKIINYFCKILKEYRSSPESRFIRFWMLLRAIVASVIIASAALRGSHLAYWHWALAPIDNFCIAITTLDFIIKLFMPYYDNRGLSITSKRKCILHYLTRGFGIDLFSWICQWPLVIKAIVGAAVKSRIRNLVIMIGKACATYLISGTFNYYADTPSVRSSFILIIKWHVIVIFVYMISSRFLIWECCTILFNVTGKNAMFRYMNRTCWMPVYFRLDSDGDGYISFYEYQLICAQSWSLTQNAFFNSFSGQNHFEENREIVTFLFCCLSLFFWYQMCYCQAALILHFRKDHLIRHSISHLKQFLKSERINDGVIERAMKYCKYWCRRTEGIDHQFLMEKISIVLRQDLFYYFYKRTLKATNTIFKSSDSSIRQLAGLVDLAYFLPNEDIIREMDLCNTVFIVHRGSAAVHQKGKRIATLTKGCIFGLLSGKASRPSPITVHTEEHTDLLYIPAENFQAVISNDIRKKIAENMSIKYNFITLDRPFPENPYNTVEFIMRRRKAIKLPKMKKHVSSDQSACYRRWLLWAWILNPLLSCAVISSYITTPIHFTIYFKIIFISLDILHGIYLVSEFYTMKLSVIVGKCGYRRVGWKNLTYWWYILQWFSLLLPLLRFTLQQFWWIHLVRFIRLYMIKMYWKEFYSDFGGKSSPKAIKVLILLVFLHVLATGWIALSCRMDTFYRDGFPDTNLAYIPSNLEYLDFAHWTLPNSRKEGCLRTSKSYAVPWLQRRTKNFYVPRHWYMDYIVALTYVLILQTRLNMDIVMPVDLVGIYYKIFAAHCLYLTRICVCSYAVSSIYGKYREMYHFDYNVSELVSYMRTNGVSYFLTHSVEVYTKMLWKRHKGSQLPEITYQMPICLREDVFEALYMYHLQTPILFQCLPPYFLRQMVVRLKRNFVFPGKYIVLEGDIHACLYFIHEGEVEKWYTDFNGENRLASVLTTNGYFGILPGLFPNVPYQFSYYSRTIVDIVSLTHSDWLDLLDGYPDIRNKLYTLASKMKMKITAEKNV